MTPQRPRERLEKTLARVAREQGLNQERLRRWVSFLALCGALDQAVQNRALDSYYLKGESRWNSVSPGTPALRRISMWQ